MRMKEYSKWSKMEGGLEKTELHGCLSSRLDMQSLERVSEITRECPQVVTLRDRAGCTCLHLVAKQTSIFDMALAQRLPYVMAIAGVDVNAVDNSGETALHKAVKRNAVELVHSLLRVGVDPTIVNKAGQEAIALVSSYPWDLPVAHEIMQIHTKFYPGLRKAIEMSTVEDVSRICQCWCRVPRAGDAVLTPEGTKADNSNGSGVQNILDKYRARNNMIHAMLAKDYTLMKALLKPIHPLQLNCFDASTVPIDATRPCMTLLDAALPDFDAVQILVTHGADVNCPNINGPVFMYDGAIDDNRVYDLLVDNADLSLKDSQGRTLLMLMGTSCKYHVSEEMIDRLVSKGGVAIFERDQNGTSLRDACINIKPNADHLTERRSAICRKLDNYIHNLICSYDCKTLETYVLNSYGYHLLELCRLHRHDDVADILGRIKHYQGLTTRLRLAAAEGDIATIDDIITTNQDTMSYRDFAGRSILMIALIHKRHQAAEHITRHYPEILIIKDNMSRSALHYAAHIHGCEGAALRELIYKCGDDAEADVLGLSWRDYVTDGCQGNDWLEVERKKIYNKTGIISYFYRSLKNEVIMQNLEKIGELLQELCTYGLALDHLDELHGFTLEGAPYVPLLFVCIQHDAWDSFNLLLNQGANYNIRYQECPCSCECVEDPNSCVHFAKSLEQYGGKEAQQRLQAFLNERDEDFKMADLIEKLGIALSYVANARPYDPINQISSQISNLD